MSFKFSKIHYGNDNNSQDKNYNVSRHGVQFKLPVNFTKIMFPKNVYYKKSEKYYLSILRIETILKLLSFRRFENFVSSIQHDF